VYEYTCLSLKLLCCTSWCHEEDMYPI